MGQLVAACRTNGVTDFLIIQEHRGEPDGLIICHFPYGPTAYFTISGTVIDMTFQILVMHLRLIHISYFIILRLS